jgi:hypothetical protein
MYGKGDVQASKIRSAAAPNGDTKTYLRRWGGRGCEKWMGF